MVSVTRRFEFSAAHRYWRDDWTSEENLKKFGKTSSPYGHGHNYELEATVVGAVDPVTGMVINLTELKSIVNDVLDQFDHKHLNEDTPYFKDTLPTTENIVAVLWRLIQPRMPEGVTLARLRLAETKDLWAEYTGESSSLTRSYSFSAAHRLNVEELSPEENRETFGKCNNPLGHGHQYTVEVTVSGPLDPKTAMVMDLVDLDAAVESVLEPLDHHHLDREIPAFAGRPSTGENIVTILWEALRPKLALLSHLKLWETNNNFFEFAGE
jgi:6-pyruvoyltetrahydropterin/6-carboxytetrahydropterin synthase